MSMIFREATLNDKKLIADFQVRMAKETEGIDLNEEVCRKGVENVFADNTLGVYYVCEMEGSVVSSLLITYEWSDWKCAVVWWIQSVYVLPDYRKRGIFSGFYDYIKTLARQNNNVRGIRLYVDKRNTVAQKTYEKLGMNGEHYKLYEWLKY